ncbi:MAG: ArnT family glycosyltransferase, partial [Nitrospinota bacterium]
MHVSGKELKKNFSVALALLLTAILPALHLYSIQENPTFQIPVIDSMEYFSAAKKIAGGALLETRLEHLSLLYTWFLASIFSVFGNELLVVKAGQILLNVGSAFFLYLAVLELSSKKEAVVALYIWAFYGPILFFTCEILSIGFILFFYTLSIYMVTLARKQKSLVGWGRAGFVLGLSVLARPDIVLFLGLLGLMLLFSFPGDKDGFKKRAGIIFFFSFFASLPLFLASSITYSSSGEFRFLPADSGLNLFIGNNPESAKSIGARPGLYWDSLSEHPGKAGGDGSSRERNSFYHEAVGAFLLEHFSAFTRNLAFKTMTLVNGYELPSTLDIYSFRKYSVVLTILTWTTAWFSFPWGVLMPLGIVGIWIDRGNKEYRWL